MSDLIQLSVDAGMLARANDQMVGENNDYYITLEQLDRIIKGYQILPATEICNHVWNVNLHGSRCIHCGFRLPF